MKSFSYLSSKPYVVTTHLNDFVETVQMRDHNICFYAELTKVIPEFTKNFLPRALCESQMVVVVDDNLGIILLFLHNMLYCELNVTLQKGCFTESSSYEES